MKGNTDELVKVLKIIAVELRRVRWALDESDAEKDAYLRKCEVARGSKPVHGRDGKPIRPPRRRDRYETEPCDELEGELRLNR